MGIIGIYRSSATHWYMFGVHTLCCSQDRAVFPIFPNENSSISLIEIGKTALSREQHNVYWVTLKLIEGKIHYFVREGKSMVKFVHTPQ